MRHSWRLFLLRNYCRCSSLQFSTQVKASAPSLSLCRSLSSLHTISRHSQFTRNHEIENPINSKNPMAYNFSSEPLVEPKKDPDHHLLVVDVFTKFTDVNDISKELELNGVVISHEMVLKVLKSLSSSPDAARRFFDWVLERDSERLSSKAYNWMLGNLGANGLVEEFWGLVEIMKTKGYGVSKGTRDRVMEKFEKEGLKSDLERLKGVFASGSVDNSIEKTGLRLSRIVRNQVWGEDVEKQIMDLNVAFSSDLVKIVVESLAIEPMKALIFFRWVEESGLCEHDEGSYNAMARVLGREDCKDRFWKVLDEMRSKGYEMELETYVKVLGRFVKRKLMEEAVELYEFAMSGANKPTVQNCTFLLRKIVAAKELDMSLFSRVVKVYIGNGNVLTDSVLNTVLKSLTSVGRFGDCNKVLKEMEEVGFAVGGNMQSKIAFGLSSTGKKDETIEFVDHMEASGNNLDHRAWVSLVEGHCVSGNLEKASDCFQNMVEKEGFSTAGYAFELLVNAYCCKNRAVDACKLLHDYASKYQLKPNRNTYQMLTSNLLVQDGFKDALTLLDLMKNHGFPPLVDPFINYISKFGTGSDAVAFMKAMTYKKFPSTSVVIHMFEAFFKAGRHSEAQDLLSQCPGYVRNHADVLNLFYSIKTSEDTAAATVAV